MSTQLSWQIKSKDNPGADVQSHNLTTSGYESPRIATRFPQKNPPACTMASRLKDIPFTLDLILLRISRTSVGYLCCLPSLDFPGLWSMSNKWRNEGRGNMLGQGTCQGKLRRIFKGIVVLKGISPCLRSDFPNKWSQVHPRVAMIGIPSIELIETVK